MAVLYEEARRPRSTLPPHLRQSGPVDGSFARFERHGVEEPAGGTDAVVFFLYSLDGEPDEELWYRGELWLDAAVLERAVATLGNEGLDQALVAIGICAACWLLMQRPRTSLRVAAAAHTMTDEQLAFWTRTLRGTLAEFQYLNRLPFHPVVVRDAAAGAGPGEQQQRDSGEQEPAQGKSEVTGDHRASQDERAARASVLRLPTKPTDGVLVPLGR
jgi:hypothetical protein